MSGCAALVLAGGSGRRFGGDVPKQFLPVAGVPILRRAAEAFLRHASVDRVQLVIRPEDGPLVETACAGLALPPPVAGGETRQDSARLGLEALAVMAPDRVLIHDGARPFIDAALIDRTLAALESAPAVVPALAVTDTLKRTDASGRISETVDRLGLWRAQTPQGFRYADIMAAHRSAAGKALTDDAMVAEAAGLMVAIVAGSEDNVKITTEDDLARAERALTGGAPTRIGMGFDVHRFTDGDHVMLCGLRIPHDRALEGHSDADAGLHALTDALLGAIGAGDIGSHFPPSDERWRGAPSDVFLRYAGELVRERGGEVVNLDLTIICERPKIGPYREAMCARVAEILGIPRDLVSIKATTTEGLGFTGRREGLAAQAVAAVRLRPER